MPKILLVEDDLTLVQSLLDLLEAEGHKVDCAPRVDDGLSFMERFEYELVILDWKLPDGSGLELCSKFRSGGGAAPILMLTGKDSPRDKVQGLDSGADDYLTKPFDPDELTARVRALLRRKPLFVGNQLKHRDLIVDLASHEVWTGTCNVKLTPTQFDLLCFFLRHPDQIFSCDALLDRVWHSDSEVNSTAVRRTVMQLRRLLGKDLIENVHGVGYLLRKA